MLVVMVVGLRSPRQVGQSGYSVGFVEVKDGREVLDVEEGHHVGKGQGHRSIRAIDGPRLQGEHSMPKQSPRVHLIRWGQSHPKTFPKCAIGYGRGDCFPQSRALQGGLSKGM